MLKLLKDLQGCEPAQFIPQIEGWDVYDTDEAKLGTVASFIVDDQNFLQFIALDTQEQLYMVPLEQIKIDYNAKAVLLPQVKGEDLSKYPAYEEGKTVLEREKQYYITFAPKAQEGAEQQ